MRPMHVRGAHQWQTCKHARLRAGLPRPANPVVLSHCLLPPPLKAYTLEVERLTDDNALLANRLEQMELDLK